MIVSPTTNYDAKKYYFDISSVEDVIEKVERIALKAAIVIKSMVPVGFTENLRPISTNGLFWGTGIFAGRKGAL